MSRDGIESSIPANRWQIVKDLEPETGPVILERTGPAGEPGRGEGFSSSRP